jgi:hypothetical protein
VAALNNYWLADQDLDILAGSGGCYAAPKGQVKCQSPGTAHICGSKDELGNKCGQGGCGYLAGSDAAYLGDVFGGCLFDETAGALCCCD